MRLGLRQIKGLAEARGRFIEAERKARGLYVDVNDVVRRAGLDMKAQRVLTRGGAFDRLTQHRRAAMWNTMRKRLPLLGYVRDDDAGDLAPHSAEELLVLDYEGTGLSLDDHPMVHLRPRIQRAVGRQKLLSSRDVARAPHGTRAVVAGLVIGRQRPGTADGTCFVTLEDEGGMVNVVVWGRDFDTWRTAIVTSTFLLFRGRIEKQGAVVHLIADGAHAVTTQMVEGEKSQQAHQLGFPFQARSFH
jgi:error-prone DNA polymerase